MVRFVLSLGIVAAVGGVLATLFGIPERAFEFGNTLILAGATIMSAGIVVIALAAVLRALDQLAGNLRAVAMPEPRVGGDAFERNLAPAPALPERPAMGLGSGEWPRPSVVPTREEAPFPERVEPPRAPPPAWQGRREEEVREPGWAPAPTFRPPGAPPLRRDPEPAPRARLPGRAERPHEPFGEPSRPPPVADRVQAAAEPGERLATAPPHGSTDIPGAPPEKRRMFGWTRRSRARRDETDAQAGGPGPPSPGGLDFGAEAGRSDGPMDAWDAPRAPLRREAPAEKVSPAPPRLGPEGRPPQPEVLKSGTIDGMSYTLYTDGSIDAEFPEGRIRFASIEALRQHLETQG